MSSFKKALVTAGIVAMGVAAVACTERIYMGEVKSDGGAPGFIDPNNLDGALESGGPRLECIGTECPDPWTTCISPDGPTYKCGTDLQRDPNNCGACGNKCLEYKPIHMTSRCVEGACQLECLNPPKALDPTDWRNCNGLVDDGCEVDVFRDANNCGTCGNKCADGTACIEGKCGCPAGRIACTFGQGITMCVDPMNDDNNCGGCGTICDPPPDACTPEPPPNAYYGCREGKCGALKCQQGTADCNGDLGSGADKCGGDGCEVPDLASDDNCGGCGIKCTKPGEHCINEGNGWECGVACAKDGKVLCGFECADLLNDVGNCGACGAGCKPPGPNQARACKKGVCEYECAPGFADCNGDPSDGCEVNLNIHPANCGACGNACNIAAGQPCVEGKCLMTECDAGLTR